MKKLILLFCVSGLIAEESKLQAACLKGIVNRNDGTTEEVSFIVFKDRITSEFKMIDEHERVSKVDVEIVDGKPVSIFFKNKEADKQNSYLDLSKEKIIVVGAESGTIACVPCEEIIASIVDQMLYYKARNETCWEKMRTCDKESIVHEEKMRRQKKAIREAINQHTDKLKEEINNVLK